MDPLLLAALRSVLDPELGIDIVSLGLVYGAERERDRALVQLTMTSPTCPLGESIVAEARAALESVPGVNVAEVDLVFEPRWTPERLSPEARAQLGHPSTPKGATP
jgi:metal-sulfur cluster biosynthetic enzyme